MQNLKIMYADLKMIQTKLEVMHDADRTRNDACKLETMHTEPEMMQDEP